MRSWNRFARLLAVVFFCCTTCGYAQESDPNSETVDDILAGHSFHGESFNQGPRQSAYLMGGTGNVHFPVTTESEEVQKFVDQGVGQLHGFWDLEAERSFRHAAALDPECAMAYWGAALATLQHDQDRSLGFITVAKEKSEHVSERERDYINALFEYLKKDEEDNDEEDDDEEDDDEEDGKEDKEGDKDNGEKKEEKKESSEDKRKDRTKRAEAYIKALESISLKYPDDLEAKAFIAHRIWQNAREGVKISSYVAADALLNEIFQENPLHPAHHYCIHLWDYRHPEKAVESAARCGASAPRIAHMWHMPGHIYSRLKRYEDAVFQQEASARVDHAHMMKDRVLPDEIHNFAHNNEWLIRNLVFIGRVHDALALATNMVQLPCHPTYNTLDKSGNSASYGRGRLLQVLREYHLFEQTIELCNNGTLPETNKPEEQIKQLRLLGCAAAYTENAEMTEQTIWHLEAKLKDLKQKRADAEAVIAEMDALLEPEEGQDPPESSLTESEAKAKKSEAKKTSSESKRRISQVEKAVSAIKGYQSYRDGNYAEAQEFLEDAKGEDLTWVAELQFLAGEQEEAIKQVREQVGRRKEEVIPLARLVYLLYKAKQLDECRESFEQLRQTSSSIDLDIPLFSRLEPIAMELGFGKNWLIEKKVAADIGFRPPLDSLGPMRWSPPQTPDWSIESDSRVGSQKLEGRAHLVIFYLGYECLHCAEQLSAFGPRYDEFAEAGIEMMAISTDGEDGLKRSIADYEGHMPIPLYSDEQLKVFKQFRAFDDFENQPLHGTFLISPNGRVLWQDIGYEPFMDHDFLFEESKRLLKLDYESSVHQLSGSE